MELLESNVLHCSKFLFPLETTGALMGWRILLKHTKTHLLLSIPSLSVTVTHTHTSTDTTANILTVFFLVFFAGSISPNQKKLRKVVSPLPSW